MTIILFPGVLFEVRYVQYVRWAQCGQRVAILPPMGPSVETNPERDTSEVLLKVEAIQFKVYKTIE